MKSCFIFGRINLFITGIFILFSAIFMPLLAGVNPDGSFGYNVDLKLPHGTRGLAPKLSLVYNSNGRNGMMGLGWELSGIPAITRDTTFSIDYDGSDSYVGPSGRLVWISSDNSYHSENESFSRYEMVGGRGGISGEPKYWIETRPDGTKLYYGLNEFQQNSQVTAVQTV